MDELVNMRYFYYCNNYSNPIASIYKFWNLQTTVCSGYWRRDIKLPPEIWKMPQLRHVQFDGNIYLPHPPCSEMKGEENSIVVLENLQTLSGILNIIWTEEVLKRIPNLRKLAVDYDFTAAVWEECYINNLVHLTKLESFKCHLRREPPFSLVNITFSTSLRKLTLDRIKFQSKLPNFRSMPNLEVLKFRWSTFPWLRWEPNEGEFLKLKYLLLYDVYLNHWIADSIHFSNLERLQIWGCEELDEIPSGFEEILTLQSIELFNCGDSIVESAKKIEEEQLSLGNDAFKLSIW